MKAFNENLHEIIAVVFSLGGPHTTAAGCESCDIQYAGLSCYISRDSLVDCTLI